MIINDILYGKIELKGIYEEIANTEEFKRLDDITQTAMSALEYPILAEETRYEHSIGVYYLMCQTLNILDAKLAKQGIHISKEEKELAKLAALLHDIGHGVNSHLLEVITGVSHEQRGIDIIKDSSMQIHQILVKHYGKEFVEKLVSFMECIYGNRSINEPIKLQQNHTVPLKPLLATLISHNIDLDRLDYIRRESKYVGFGVLTNIGQLLNSFQCILTGKQMSISIPEEKMHYVEVALLERARNYQQIYFHTTDFLGNHAFEELLTELRNHPEEVPNTVSMPIRKFLTMKNVNLTNQEYMSLTNKPLAEALEQIKQFTQSEKIRYLCDYKKYVKRDYQVLYNGRNETYIRKLLAKVIPNFSVDTHSIFSKTQKITPYKKTKFGSTNITTKMGIQKFEDLPHFINLKTFSKTVLAINPELLRLELGISKKEFEKNYAAIIQEVITSQAKPVQDFELKYVIPAKTDITYGKMLKLLEQKYQKQDSATYRSKDTYYDLLENFSLLSEGKALRTRNGITYYKGSESHSYKNKRITYKTYEEDGKAEFTARNKSEEIGNSTNLQDYKEFLSELGLENKPLEPVLEVSNFRKLVTFLVNGCPIDISFNIAKCENTLNRAEEIIDTIEIKPRDNQITRKRCFIRNKANFRRKF
ncbi:MAG: HD domain-containing protein [Clostridia bacterium]|nr:HD domain-containing protein [Clostridia bacterium]